MTQEQINKIIENHQHWLREDVKGWINMKADFSNQDLRDVDLRGVDLAFAELRNTNLRGADLTFANLRGADLSAADLSKADLSLAILSEANLSEANLDGAHLDGAHLNGANLLRTDLRGIKNLPYIIPMTCPEQGSFIGFKKAGSFIVELEIPSDARRSSGTGRKCRCDKAKVLSIQNLDGTIANINKIASNFDRYFIYKIGETVEEPNFDDDHWNECSKGIHFFISRQEAVDY